MRKLKNTSYSLVSNMKLIASISIVIIFFNIIVCVVSISNIKVQNQKNIEDLIEIYQDETATKMNAIAHFIQWTVVHDPLLTALETADGEYERGQILSSLRTRVSDTQYATGTEYNYFLYLNEQDAFYSTSALNLPFQEYLYIKSTIRDFVNTKDLSQYNFTWQALKSENRTYMYYLIQYYNRTFFTIIDITDLLMPLTDINFGTNGYIEVTDLNETILFRSSSPASEIAAQKMENNSFFYSQLDFSNNNLPFHLRLYCDNFSNYGQIMLFQLVIILSALGLCIVLALYIIHVHSKLITPLQTFSDKLAGLKEQEELIDLQSSNIQELEQTSLHFKNLLREIKRLKIDIYEKELSKKHFEITFLQNQIRPHFYLNCLTTIGSMAQLGKFEEINSMVIFVSRYLRYLFQTDKEQVQIKYELSHIKAYTDIQTLRLGNTFHYNCFISSEEEDALIPPLLLITFVENTLKHCQMTDGKTLKITLTVTKAAVNHVDYLQIDIADSGQGFPPEILDSLSRGESLNSAIPHVGITNSVQRLSLLYDKNYSIYFYNESSGGAHIRIRIPYKLEENKDEFFNC